MSRGLTASRGLDFFTVLEGDRTGKSPKQKPRRNEEVRGPEHQRRTLEIMADVLTEAIKQAVREALAEAGTAPTPQGPRLMRVTAAAEYMDCTPQHIHNLIARGVLKPVRWPLEGGEPGRTVWLDRTDLDRAIEDAKNAA
jgi:hypothetical protein